MFTHQVSSILVTLINNRENNHIFKEKRGQSRKENKNYIFGHFLFSLSNFLNPIETYFQHDIEVYFINIM